VERLHQGEDKQCICTCTNTIKISTLTQKKKDCLHCLPVVFVFVVIFWITIVLNNTLD
jgi:hypothetical protein